MASKQANPRVAQLDKISGVRAELAKLYRQTRRGQIPIEDLTRYASVLRIIAELVLATDVEVKVAELEKHRPGIGLRAIKDLRQAA